MDERDQNHDDGSRSGEQAPLLPASSARPRRPAHRHTLSVASIASIGRVNVPKVHNGNTILNLLCLIIIVASSAGGFVAQPLLKLVEAAVCRRMLGVEDPFDEGACKVESVQTKVAFVFAVVGVCESVVGFLAAFPWGIAADRIGRRPVFALSLTGLAASVLWSMLVLRFDRIFPPELLAFSSAFMLLGGGNAVLVNIMMSIVSDTTTEATRATAFMRVHVSSLVGNLVSPVLASVMMTATGPWPVMWVPIGCLLTSAIAILFIPETIQHKPDTASAPPEEIQPQGLKDQVSHTLERLKESFSILKSPSLILLLVMCLVTMPCALATLQFMVQFISKRYQVAIEYTGYVQSTLGAGQVVQALLILPWISRRLSGEKTAKRLHIANEQERDLALAKWSFGLLILGYLFLAAAPTLWLFILGLLILALGSAATSLTRSLMSLYVDPAHRSRLFSLVGMVEVIGSLYGPPMLAGLFTVGMRIGEPCLGLPYLGIAGLAVISLAILLFVRLPERRDSPPPPYEEEPVRDV